tara:strand:+ start:105 stop:803 length:699 start_codon:yes stop_codon:yes gene_type:complete
MIIYKLFSIIFYLIAGPVFVLSSIVLLFIGLFYLPLFYSLSKFFCRLILLSFGAIIKISGSFPKKGTFIIMMNHSSFLDIFLFPLIVNGRWSGITAIENFKYPILSLLLHRVKAIPIERDNIKSAINSISMAEAVLQKEIHIGILPEGSRTTNGTMLPFKKGPFHMAINTKTPILPIGVSGAFSCKPKNRWWIKPGLIAMKIGSPIHVDKYSSKNLDSLMAMVKNEIFLLQK